MTNELIEDFRRMVGVGPSVVERASGGQRAMLDVLSKAFSVKVKPSDVKFIRFRTYKGGVELEDVGDRLGNILTSVEGKEADPKQLVAWLKKHGAKALKKEDVERRSDRKLEESEVWTPDAWTPGGTYLAQGSRAQKVMSSVRRTMSPLKDGYFWRDLSGTPPNTIYTVKQAITLMLKGMEILGLDKSHRRRLIADLDDLSKKIQDSKPKSR